MNYIICGPAGSGKSTYVRNNMQPGDLVVDLDAIYAAISCLGSHRKPSQLADSALSVYKYLVDSIDPDARNNTFPNAWIIASGARLSERKFLKDRLNAKVIVFEIDVQECLRRIEIDDDRKGYGIPWGKIVTGWWDNYEPGDV